MGDGFEDKRIYVDEKFFIFWVLKTEKSRCIAIQALKN